MASLVADYGSSSASEEEDALETDGPETVALQSGPDATDKEFFNDYLGCGGAVAGDEDDDDDDTDSPSRESRPTSRSPASLLPRPNFSGTDGGPGPAASATALAGGGGASVFANPFLAAEEAKNQLLEKHVKMTPTSGQGGRSGSGNRHVCWNFRKGRCRFGQNCRFGHDSDLHLINRNQTDDGIAVTTAAAETTPTLPPTNQQQQTVPTQDAGGGTHYRGGRAGHNRVARYVMNAGGVVDQLPDGRAPGRAGRHSATAARFVAEEGAGDGEEGGDTQARAKRKKPGLTNTLLPPKRSLKSFKQQQQQERPWLAK